MRIVLDVNILASASALSESTPDKVVMAVINGSHELVASSEMLSKLEDVLQRPYFIAKAPSEDRAAFISMVSKNAQLVILDTSVSGVADDDEDDRVIGTAVAAGADVIVSGDKGLLALRQYQGIPIVSAREFLDILNL